VAFEDENPPLFSGMDASAVVAGASNAITRRVDSIPDAEFRSTSDDAIISSIVEELRVQPLSIDRLSVRLTERTPAAVDPAGNWCHLNDNFRRRDWPRGVHATVSVPFEGASTLWQYAPGAEFPEGIRGNIEEESDTSGWLHIKIAVGGDDFEQKLKRRIDENLDRISIVLQSQRSVIDDSNRELALHARTAVAERRRYMQRIDDLPRLLEIPLIVRDGRAVYQPVPLRRRAVTPMLVESNESAESQYQIGIQGYEQILHVCRHFGRSFEASPRGLRSLSEPEIRDLFLGALNTYFEGAASGERFRREGYSDVLIEEKNRSAFVGEFKLWRGPKCLIQALDQLLKYTTWRDSMCAVVLFSRNNKDFAAVRDGISATLAQHASVRSRTMTGDAAEWRVVLRRTDEGGDEMTVHIFAFHIWHGERKSVPRKKNSAA
jgi:hypothetical protein